MNPGNQDKPIRSQPGYVLALVGLASLLIVMAVVYPRGSLYVGESVLVVPNDADGSAEEQQTQLRSLLLADNTLSAAAKELGADATNSPELETVGPDRVAHQLARRLQLMIDAEEGQQTVRVQYSSRSRDAAIEIANVLARQFVAAHGSWAPELDPQQQAATQRIAQLKNQLKKLRSERERFMSETLRQLRDHLVNEQLALQQSAEDTSKADDTDTAEITDRGGEATGNAPESLDGPPANDVFAQTPKFPSGDEGEIDNPDEGLAAQEPSSNDDSMDAATESSDAFDTSTVSVAPPSVPTLTPPQSVSATPPKNSWNDEPFQAPDVLTGVPSATSVPSAIDAAEPSQPNVSAEPLPMVQSLNPRWSAITNLISRKRVDLELLREKLTDAHPRVVDTQMELDELASELATTPRFINESPPAVPSFTPIPDANPNPEVPNVLPELDQRAELERRFNEPAARERIMETDEYREFTNKIADVEQTLAEAISINSAPPERRLIDPARIQTEATIIQQHEEVISAFDFLTMLLPAGLIGLVTAMVRTPMVAPPVLHSVDDVQQALDIPMIGAVSTKDGPEIPTPQPGGPPKWVRGVVLVSELVVLASLTLMLIGLIQLPDFVGQLVRNPLGAYIQSFDHIASIVTSL